MHWNKVTLVGVGLLGGSLGKALRERKLASQVTGFVRRRSSLAECTKAGAADQVTLSLKRAVQGADLIVLCTPVGQMRALLEQILPLAEKHAIVTDVGSVKGTVVRDLEPLARNAGLRFVGSHPMAGSEKIGVRAARTDLYEGSVCIVTPTARTDRDALEWIEALWLNVGARVLSLSPDQHDALVSRSSHLPHMAAACMAAMVLDPAQPKVLSALCANGFKDTTRIASGSPEMWCDIAVANSKHLSSALAQFGAEIEKLRKIVDAKDAKRLREILTRAKHLRDAWRQAELSSSSPE